MSAPSDPQSGVDSIYATWLGLIPQFFGQLGATMPAGAGAGAAAMPGLAFPLDQVARAATMTRAALQSMATVYAPMLQAAGASGLLGQWAAAMPLAAGMGSGGAASPSSGSTAAPLAFQALQQAWIDFGSQLAGSLTRFDSTAFDRTFGALSDAFGLGPLRQFQAAYQDLLAVNIAQNDARAKFAMLVQGAFTAGFDRLLARLADMAAKGERIVSVLALLRLWAVCTEEAVHDVLQSEQGLAATAALSRAGIARRRKLQHIAGIVADALDMATRRDLDDAFREIQELKRQLRARQQPAPAQVPAARPTANRRRKGGPKR
jgi:hypothetical protein